MRIITADLDTKNATTLSDSIFYTLFHIKEIKKIILKRSAKKGYHLIVYTDRDYSQNYIYRVRAIIGDDKSRIKHDKKRKLGQQTLFDKKKRLKKVVKRR